MNRDRRSGDGRWAAVADPYDRLYRIRPLERALGREPGEIARAIENGTIPIKNPASRRPQLRLVDAIAAEDADDE
jgi:hypothetical protein